MLAVTTRSFAPRMRPPTLRRRGQRGRKNSPPTAMPAAAAPSRDANSRREMPSLLSFRSLATLTSFWIRARPVTLRRRILACAPAVSPGVRPQFECRSEAWGQPQLRRRTATWGQTPIGQVLG